MTRARTDRWRPPGDRAARVLAVLLVVGAPVWTDAGRAQAEPVLDANDFAIDVVQGPVLGAGRIVGLGGAYTALADGIDGAPWNPAAYGSRTLWELSWFDWEPTAGLLFPGAFRDNDFFNSGRDGGFFADDFLFLSLGLRFQLGPFGLGSLTRLQAYRVGAATDPDAILANFTIGNYGVAHQLLDGQVVVGVGGRTAGLDLSLASSGVSLVSFTGTGLELGLLLRLDGRPWRLGAAGRMPVRSRRIAGDGVETGPTGVRTVHGFVMPREVHMPWEVQLGFAWQIGARPLNQRWVEPWATENAVIDAQTLARWRREVRGVRAELAREGLVEARPDPYRWLPRRARDPDWWRAEVPRRLAEDGELEAALEAAERERERAVRRLSREYVLLTAEVTLVGPTPRGVGVEGFLAQAREESGRRVTVGARLGAEVEPWATRLKLRAGTYLEPSRFAGSGVRPHATGGFDLRLFTWDLFGAADEFDLKVGLNADVAPRYFDWGVSVGFWH